MMRIYKIFLLVLFTSEIFAQTGSFYRPINKEYYDSLQKFSWYKGKVFLMNGKTREVLIKRVPLEPIVKVKDSLKGKEDYLSANLVQGWYDLYKGDTAWFVFMDIDPKRTIEMRSLRIVKKGDLTLMIDTWVKSLERKNNSEFIEWINPSVYEIHWDYYFYKNGKLNKVVYPKRDIKNWIDDSPEALEYYKNNKRSLELSSLKFLKSLTQLYNNDQNK